MRLHLTFGAYNFKRSDPVQSKHSVRDFTCEFFVDNIYVPFGYSELRSVIRIISRKASEQFPVSAMSAQKCHTWGFLIYVGQDLRICQTDDSLLAETPVAAAAEPYELSEKLAEMAIEILVYLLEFLVFLIRE